MNGNDNTPEESLIMSAQGGTLQITPRLRWVKRGEERILQQMWADPATGARAWEDIPAETESVT